VNRLAEGVLAEFGQLDILVNNAGWDWLGFFSTRKRRPGTRSST
jgi:NAD(P)-dependent dehydrogenase (short-subunit alcohol dehydrogenase family)